MPNLIIDCDPGHDDAIAIVLAHHDADVLGITTASGNASLDNVTANAHRIVTLLGIDTPVYKGASTPLVEKPKHAPPVHGASGLNGVDLPQAASSVAGSALEFLLDSAAADTWLVALGPLTNLALAIQRDKHWLQRFAGVSIMGGSSTLGNVTSVAEFNFFCDPEAAAMVLQSGADITLCGLNVTHQFTATDETIAVVNAIDTPLSRFGAQSLGFLLDRLEDITAIREAALHDPCAVLAVTQPDLFTTTDLRVDIELKGTLTRGMSVVDRRIRRTRNKPNVKFATAINSAQAFEHLITAFS